MKNRNVFLFLCGLALTLTMYNCQRVDEPLPIGPNADLLKDFNAIRMAPINLVAPEAVVSTPSALLPAPVMLDFQSQLAGSNGQLPAEFRKATDALTSTFSADQINLLAATNTATVNNLFANGALPENMKTIVERAESSAALSTYLAKAVLSTVQEVKPAADVQAKPDETFDKNARTAAKSCKAQAQEAYQQAVENLREQRRQQFEAAQAQKQADITAANAAFAACKANTSSGASRADAQARANQEIATINASNYPRSIKNLLIALVNIQLIQEMNAINQMDASDNKSCEQARVAAIFAANSALTANRANIQDNYEAQVEAAKDARAAFIANCEYQQGQGL